MGKICSGIQTATDRHLRCLMLIGAFGWALTTLSVTAQASSHAGHAMDPSAAVAAPITLFQSICVATAGDATRVQRELDQRGFRQAPAGTRSNLVHGGPGGLWLPGDGTSSALPAIAVTTRPAGHSCQVTGHFTDPVLARIMFLENMKALTSTHTLVVELVSDYGLHGLLGFQRMHRATPLKGGAAMHYAFYAREPLPGRVAILMTASLAR